MCPFDDVIMLNLNNVASMISKDLIKTIDSKHKPWHVLLCSHVVPSYGMHSKNKRQNNVFINTFQQYITHVWHHYSRIMFQ